MNDFRKNGAHRPRQGGFSRPSFGGKPSGARDFKGPAETFKTSCSKCHAACEVPFRPNGKKPVFCKNCFVRDDERSSERTFERRMPERAQAPKEDPRIGAILRELAVVHEKLDTLMASLEGAAYASILSASNERAQIPVKKATKKAAKK